MDKPVVEADQKRSYLLRATIPIDLALWLKKLSDGELRTESNMTEVLIREAKSARETRKPRTQSGGNGNG